jgi:hypothetical protein
MDPALLSYLDQQMGLGASLKCRSQAVTGLRVNPVQTTSFQQYQQQTGHTPNYCGVANCMVNKLTGCLVLVEGDPQPTRRFLAPICEIHSRHRAEPLALKSGTLLWSAQACIHAP